MKILFNSHAPFSLAQGGTQVQIERTKGALEALGVRVEELRWWDRNQGGDIVHHFGFMPTDLVTAAQAKGWKVANTVLFTQTCNRQPWELAIRRICIRSALKAPLPDFFQDLIPWRSYHYSDRMIVGLEAERNLLEKVYGVESRRIAVIPLGLSEAFLKAGAGSRTSDDLICTGRIDPSKNTLELARLAHAAKVNVLFVGKPSDANGAYWKEFHRLVDGKYVKLHGHVDGEAGIIDLLRAARGYVLMSRFENWCLAAHEAAACGLPLLLPDQPWSRERFGNQASYFPRVKGDTAVKALRRFYEQCLNLPAPGVRLYTWREVAERLLEVYTGMLAAS